VLNGVILNLSVAPVSFDEQGRATEYMMTLTTSVKLFDNRASEPKLLWEDLAFSRRNSYLVDPNAPTTSTARCWQWTGWRRTTRRRWSAPCWKASRSVSGIGP